MFSAGGGIVSGASGGDSFGWIPLMARLSLRRSLNTADFGMGIGVPPAGGAWKEGSYDRYLRDIQSLEKEDVRGLDLVTACLPTRRADGQGFEYML